MKIIDCHLHYSKIASFFEASYQNGVNYSKEGLVDEFRKNNVVQGIIMGLSEHTANGLPDREASNPMLTDLDSLPASFYYCAGINPHLLNHDSLLLIENELKNPLCVGLKIYAGYYHFYLLDPVYTPIYELAWKYDLPVVIHTGDTYSTQGLLKYAHPLLVDELAVRYPEVKFIIAHLGNPWLMDTAEVLYKNKNVYADLSGLQVGDAKLFQRFCSQELYLNMFRSSLILADAYDKLVYGSDWPLAPIDIYIDFIKLIIPEEHHEAVFYKNALNLFTRLRI